MSVLRNSLNNRLYGNPILSDYLAGVPQYPDIERRVKELTWYLLPEHRRFISEKVYPFANKWHDGQVRKTGGPYIEHPVAVAEILSKYRVQVWVLAAALLHDTYEDSDGRLTLDVVENYFGPYIRATIDGLTKIGKASASHRYYLSENPQLRSAMAEWASEQRKNVQDDIKRDAKIAKIKDKNASLAKLFIGITDDPTVMLVKIADRLHNMRTMESSVPGKQVRTDKQKRISRETLKFFVPIASRLGIWEMKTELENLCFRYCYPNIYKYTVKRFSEIRKDVVVPALEALKAVISKNLEENYITADISIADNSDYSLFYRLKHNKFLTDSFHSLSYLQIIAEEPRLCPYIKDCICKIFRNAQCRDFIEHPKSNGYKAVHISFEYDILEGEFSLNGRDIIKSGKFVDIQICSREDFERNKIGVFSIFKDYKIGINQSGQEILEKIREMCAPWISSMRSLREAAESDADFLDLVLNEDLSEKVTCFTPKGDSVSLPAGSVPLDFACSVHKGMTVKCSGAVVNNESVSIVDYQLKNYDFVEILTSDDVMPRRDWYDKCRTRRAKDTLSRWYLQNYSRESNSECGKIIMDNFFRSEGVGRFLDDACFAHELARLCGCSDIADMKVRLGARCIREEVFKEKLSELLASRTLNKTAILIPKDLTPLVNFECSDGVRLSACRACSPIFGDPIVAVRKNSIHFILHRSCCISAQNAEGGSSGSIVKAEWKGCIEDAPMQCAAIKVTLDQELTSAEDIIAACEMQGTAVAEYASEYDKLSRCCIIRIRMMVNSAEELNNLCSSLRTFEGIKDISR